MSAKIKRRTCTHTFQDQRYGQQMRVHNETQKTPGKWVRCTVCGSEKHAGD